MVAITYVEQDGKRHTVDVEEGMSLMAGATLNMVPGIEGMCGGICSCATCHCYLPASWQGKAGAPAEGEAAMLDAISHRRPNSRLGCQVVVTQAAEGLEVELPVEQGG